MKIDPRHLEILAAIVASGGLTEGAVALGKSQPSVSRSLALLEARVGQPLFEPRRRPLVPTEVGTALAAEGKRILEAGRAASELIEAFSRGRAGAIRVAGTPIFLDGVISEVIAEYQGLHANVRIDQSYAYPPEALEKIHAEKLDLAILPVRPADLGGEFRYRQILKGRNVIACRSGHPLTKVSAMSSSDIVDFPWIAPPADSPLAKDLRNLLDGMGQRDLRISFSGGSLSAIVNVLLGSDSLTVLPFSVVCRQQRHNSLEILPIEIGDPNRHLGIVTSKLRPEPEAARRFADFVEVRFRDFQQPFDGD